MSKKSRTPQAPKARNFVAKEVRDPNGPYRPRAIPLKNKYNKHKKLWQADVYDE